MELCFECGSPAEHDHHVVPQSLGGTRTIPLCAICHDHIHDHGITTSELVKAGQARARAMGVHIGRPRAKADELIFENYMAARLSYRKIAKRLGLANSTAQVLIERWRESFPKVLA